MLYFFFISTIIHLSITLLFTGFIITEKRMPERTLAWIFAVYSFPVIGICCYFFAGRHWDTEEKDRQHNKHQNITNTQQGLALRCTNEDSLVEATSSLDSTTKRLIRFIQANAGAELTQKNHVKLFHKAAPFYTALWEKIDKAMYQIHVLFYTIEGDYVGRSLLDLLKKKAEQGCEVRVIVDDIGSKTFPDAWGDELRQAGGEFYRFSPRMHLRTFMRLNYRNHRKIVVIDNAIGFFGGCNIGKEYVGEDPKLGFWRDTHIQVTGEAACELQKIFIKDWKMVSGLTINMSNSVVETSPAPTKKHDEEMGKPTVEPVGEHENKHMIQVVATDPRERWEPIRQAFLQMIMRAEKSVKITSPYFIPDEVLLAALCTIAQAGVEVTLMLPGIPDSKLVYYASQSFLDELRKAGVSIYLYDKGFLHAKVLLVDDNQALVGTSNWDFRSFYLNFEVNALFYGRSRFIQELTAQFEQDISNSKVSNEEPKSISRKYVESVARLFSPLL
ncbi:cardiolipin synthase [Brevibacillus sp. SKDU10]|uniref:cardiolipin synthase n=1 Tax=Brevibacillus sp. SKDU10 TaxID=1247872 RepID=UPI0007C97C6C|nr:cardiolipin synthase [Brevibacillus sp. SKDU10]OAJ73854.1 cardiolipin synthase [Brevibacillus sp. SKDU10]